MAKQRMLSSIQQEQMLVPIAQPAICSFGTKLDAQMFACFAEAIRHFSSRMSACKPCPLLWSLLVLFAHLDDNFRHSWHTIHVLLR